MVDLIYSPQWLMPEVTPDEVLPINDEYSIYRYKENRMPFVSISDISYRAIPKCYGLMCQEALEKSGILALQRQPNLNLYGEGVVVAIVDTGIDASLPDFVDEYGNSRILEIVDQTGGDGRDENGHGTAMARIIASAVPRAKLFIVKLKKPPRLLLDYFFVPETAVVFQESDIMLAIAKIREKVRDPLVICLGMGTNQGEHEGSSALCGYLDEIGSQKHVAITTPAGNEVLLSHHYEDILLGDEDEKEVELYVEKPMRGFYVEIWSPSPQRLDVFVRSPLGEENNFSFSGAKVTIIEKDVGRYQRNQLIFVRVENAVEGIWTIRVRPRFRVDGRFLMWLPIRGLLEGQISFLRPEPRNTIVSPGDAWIPMTVGGYNQATNQGYLESSRGFLWTGRIKPDFLAPAVNLIEGYEGTSFASAVAAGACAQMLEWAVIKKNAIGIQNVDIKNLLQRGAIRKADFSYPNEVSGYGQLEVWNALQQLS